MFSKIYDKMLYAWCYLQTDMLLRTVEMEEIMKNLRKDQNDQQKRYVKR